MRMSAVAAIAVGMILLLKAAGASAQGCGEVTAPQCDGACPANQACLPTGVENRCRCQATQIPCGFIDGGPGCYGFCPPDFPICNFVQDCFCIPAFTPTPTPTETPTPTSTAPPTATVANSCVGDCGADGFVTVEEIVRAVNIGLGTTNVSTCPAADANHDGLVTVEEIVSAVTNALTGCPT